MYLLSNSPKLPSDEDVDLEELNDGNAQCDFRDGSADDYKWRDLLQTSGPQTLSKSDSGSAGNIAANMYLH